MPSSQKLKSDQPPPQLAHYTNLSGLVGIVRSGKIWASNVSYLNDHRELQHGIDASLAAIQLLSTSASSTNWASALEKAARSLKAGAVPDTYAACFCRNADLLSQWRGYGGQDQGVSISFARIPLQKAFTKQANLQRVIYCDITAKNKMKSALSKALINIDGIYDLLGGTTPQEREQQAYDAICKLLPQFKHLGFQDEREYRFVVQVDGDDVEIQHRVSGNVIVPYLELGSGTRGSLPIRKVTIGPGKHQDLTSKSVSLYLKQAGYPDVEVVKSKVPFRS